MNALRQGFRQAYACLGARAELLDRINVYPVADGDTGANLRISLAVLRDCQGDGVTLAAQLRRAATGNSGNIAAAFFGELLLLNGLDELAQGVARGREQAWRAVATPQPGTMLSVFDCLAAELAMDAARDGKAILAALQGAVLASTSALPELRAAGVVDAGALAMFVFFDGFFRAVDSGLGPRLPLAELFPGRLAIAADFHQVVSRSFCVDAIVRPDQVDKISPRAMTAFGESVVVVADQDQVKIHIHTSHPASLRRSLAGMGELVAWSEESLHHEPQFDQLSGGAGTGIHIITDAAGSLPRELARQQGISLLDSYIVSGDSAQPESLCAAETIYRRLRQGEKVTTAQASLAERHELYGSICEQYGPSLYLAVGSAFTGNYAAALAWKENNPSGDLLHIVDSGTASGRLAILALLVARRARCGDDGPTLCRYATAAVERCREYVFIDCLRYLVAGGRISRTRGLVGDLLQMKPIISPERAGVRKVGVVRTPAAQLRFALAKVGKEAVGKGRQLVLLQFSDNRAWVEEVVMVQLRAMLPEAELHVVPLSLTSGVHMGPGSWSLAFAPLE